MAIACRVAIPERQFLVGIAAVALTLSALACFSPELKEGERLYLGHCSSCHGNGALGTEKGPPLHLERRQEALQQVRNSPGHMSAFPSAVLSDEEAGKIADYLIYLHQETSGHWH